jgi:CxxC motif-containing protein (DUF1111 family)
MRLHDTAIHALLAALLVSSSVLGSTAALAQTDPGVRHASTDNTLTPPALPNSTPTERAFFQDGLARFSSVKSVRTSGGDNSGLGPRYNSDACLSCHSQPFAGGSSPAVNPLPAVAISAGGRNELPWFIVANGPIREARFVAFSNGAPDGGVHDLFVVTGRTDGVSSACNIAQPDFTPAGNRLTGQGGNPNIVFRIPTPVLGAGLIEAIPDSAILLNMRANGGAKRRAGIAGHPNRNGNDGTITRFGWKAQNKSLLLFSGEAYNVEMGVSNLLFPQERDETAACQGTGTLPQGTGNLTPNDTATFASTPDPVTTLNTGVLSDMEAFADFMRTLAAPVPAAATASTQHGRALFISVGCALCHTPTLTTGPFMANGDEGTPSAALSNQPANLFSDLLVHHMGKLADGVSQGAAGPDEFRTAPLWGVGQRIFFLHDGRTSNLIQAIRFHASQGSEANQVVDNFLELGAGDQQDLINFLRSL